MVNFTVWRKGQEKVVHNTVIVGEACAEQRAVESIAEVEDMASGYTLFNIAGAAKEITYCVKKAGGTEVKEVEVARKVRPLYTCCSIIRTVLPPNGDSNCSKS